MSKLGFTVCESGDVTVLGLAGNILFGESGSELFLNLRSLIEAGKRKVLLDLRRVTAIDGGGMGAILGAHLEFIEVGGELRLCGISPVVLRLIIIARLERTITIHNDAEAAMASFGHVAVRSAANANGGSIL